MATTTATRETTALDAKALQAATKGATATARATGGHMPILFSAEVALGPDGAIIRATNLNGFYQATIGNAPEGKGLLVNAAQLAAVAKALDKGEVELSSLRADGVPEPGSGKAPDKLAVGATELPASFLLEDWPCWPQLDPASAVTVWAGTGKDFKALAALWDRIVSHDTTRLSLIGLHIEWGAMGTKFVVADESRFFAEDIPGQFDTPGTALLPASELKRATSCAGAKDAVRLSVVAVEADLWGCVEIVADGLVSEYLIRPIAEEYPDFERVVPADSAVQFTVAATDVARIAAGAKAAAIHQYEPHAVFEIVDGQLCATLLRDRYGTYSASCPVVNGHNLEAWLPTGFDADYLADMARAIAGPMDWQWSGRLKPLLVTGKTTRGNAVRCAQMPVRILDGRVRPE